MYICFCFSSRKLIGLGVIKGPATPATPAAPAAPAARSQVLCGEARTACTRSREGRVGRGAEGGGEGVKLEEQVLITDTGSETLSHYPFDPALDRLGDQTAGRRQAGSRNS